MRTPGQRNGDEVIGPIDARVDSVDQGPSIVEHERGVGLAFHADVHAVLDEDGAVTRSRKLDPWTAN